MFVAMSCRLVFIWTGSLDSPECFKHSVALIRSIYTTTSIEVRMPLITLAQPLSNGKGSPTT